MCGIAGVMGQALPPGLGSVVSSMAQRLRHRGPDGYGTWSSPSGGAILAHTRLAVFDLSPSSAQPMSVDDGRLTITYNGALYNLADLREGLGRSDSPLRTSSDTEVIVRAFERYGPACVDRFRGMFAIAIWDEHEHAGFLARDPFGMKPLYYAVRDGRLVFASELRAVVASGLVRLDLDVAAVQGYFQQGSVPEPRTLLEDVKMLPAGATARWKDGVLTVMTASDLPWHGESAPVVEAAAAARSALIDSVTNHFAGDTGVGVLLSGGADSTAILALAALRGHAGVDTFSLAIPGDAADEGPDAARTAALFGARHHTLDIDAPSARHALDDYARAIDQPTIDGLNSFVAARFAARHGVKVVLSGIGADELFGGYASFQRVPVLAAWHRVASLAGPLATWAGRAIERAAPGPKVRRIGDLLSQPPSIERAHAMFRGIFTRREAALLTRRYTPADGAIDEDMPLAAGDARESISALELTRYVRNQLLRDADVMAMASGVEVRCPFVDRVLASALWKIPPHVRLRAGKQLLAEAVPEVPGRAFDLPKRCFQFPFERWLGDEWREVFAGIDQSTPVSLETWYRKWCVFSMEQAVRNLNEARHA